MLFNPNKNKQFVEICSCHKREKKIYPPLMFNSANVQSAASPKYLCLILEYKFDFQDYINNKINKILKLS